LVRDKVGFVSPEAIQAVANLVGCIRNLHLQLTGLFCLIYWSVLFVTMASTAAPASELEGQIIRLYAAQVNNQYVSVAVACWFLWDHGMWQIHVRLNTDP
jgi:hypothetical protein